MKPKDRLVPAILIGGIVVLEQKLVVVGGVACSDGRLAGLEIGDVVVVLRDAVDETRLLGKTEAFEG